MSKIAIVADSGCDFTPVRAEGIGFSVVPLNVTFEDGQCYRDGVDITGELFFRKLEQSKHLPKTSQPTPERWMEEFQKYADYDDIICITVSAKVSGSINGAELARSLLREDGFKPNIHLIDSQTASAAEGFFAVEAAEMVKAGKSVDEILNRLTYLQDHLGVYFIFDNLEYLRKGGRIGNASAMAGKLMGIKPILTFYEGLPKNVDKVRGMQNGLKTLVDGFLKNSADLHKVTIISSCAPERVKTIRTMLQTHISDIRTTEVEIGAVIGTYVGPGGISLVYEEKEARY